MAYFPNGTAVDIYEAQYCSRCVHQGPPNGPGCAVMLAHLIHNYNECNKDDSILHLLIPHDKRGFPGECKMFMDKSRWEKSKLVKDEEKLADLFKA